MENLPRQLFHLASAAVLLCEGVVQASVGDDGKCRILSFRGGGVHGSYEVGVLNALVDHMPPEELHYDYVGGVSIGAVNASIFSLYGKGQEKEAARFMYDLWNGRETSEFFHFRSWWPIKGFSESSLADNAPFREILDGIFGNRDFKRKLSIMSSDLNTGQTIIFDETMSLADRLDGILSSTTVPLAFPTVHMDDMVLVDGSLFATISIGDPIERCREEVDDKDIIVDVITCYQETHEIDPWFYEDLMWENAHSFYRRRKKINNYYYYKEDLVRMTRGFHDVNFRLIAIPSEPLVAGGMIPISATKEDI